MNNKSILALLLMLSVLLSACGSAAAKPAEQTAAPTAEPQQTQAVEAEPEQENTEADEISAAVVAQFKELAKVPRPSSHEEQISEYLYNWAAERNLDVIRDSVNDIIFDVPATPGMEKLPMIALQTHMDMVFVSEDGLDPLTTAVTVVDDGDYLRSDGRTSLGADDGIGLSVALCIADGLMQHGPLRIIITVNEEMGMTGVQNLDPATVADIRYLINIDSEESDTVTASSAGGITYTFERRDDVKSPVGDTALMVSVSGLTGGHSGVEIDKGGANAIMLTSAALNALTDKGIAYELASVSGGTAANAITQKTSALIVVSSGDAENAKVVLSERFDAFKAQYSETDPGMVCEITDAELPEGVISAEASANLAEFTGSIINGIYTMSKDVEGLVESSSNIGLIELKDGAYSSTLYARSSSEEYMEEICAKDEALAKEYGFSFTTMKTADPWAFNPDSVLLAKTVESYSRLFCEDIRVINIHAGLECGTFAIMNPELDMVSIGPDVFSPHTVQEHCKISSIYKTWELIQDIITGLEP